MKKIFNLFEINQKEKLEKYLLFFCRFYGEFLRNVSLTNAQKYDCENEVSKQLAESLKQFYQKNPTLFSCDLNKEKFGKHFISLIFYRWLLFYQNNIFLYLI